MLTKTFGESSLDGFFGGCSLHVTHTVKVHWVSHVLNSLQFSMVFKIFWCLQLVSHRNYISMPMDFSLWQRNWCNLWILHSSFSSISHSSPCEEASFSSMLCHQLPAESKDIDSNARCFEDYPLGCPSHAANLYHSHDIQLAPAARVVYCDDYWWLTGLWGGGLCQSMLTGNWWKPEQDFYCQCTRPFFPTPTQKGKKQSGYARLVSHWVGVTVLIATRDSLLLCVCVVCMCCVYVHMLLNS